MLKLRAALCSRTSNTWRMLLGSDRASRCRSKNMSSWQQMRKHLVKQPRATNEKCFAGAHLEPNLTKWNYSLPTFDPFQRIIKMYPNSPSVNPNETLGCVLAHPQSVPMWHQDVSLLTSGQFQWDRSAGEVGETPETHRDCWKANGREHFSHNASLGNVWLICFASLFYYLDKGLQAVNISKISWLSKMSTVDIRLPSSLMTHTVWWFLSFSSWNGKTKSLCKRIKTAKKDT